MKGIPHGPNSGRALFPGAVTLQVSCTRPRHRAPSRRERLGLDELRARLDRHRAYTDAVRLCAASLVQQDVFQEVMARLLFTIVTWVRQVPAFLVLPQADQTSLLTSAWKELFLLGLVQWGLSLEAAARMVDTCRSLSREEREKLGDIMTRLRQLNLDPTEFTCLKAILLFGADVRTLTERKQVEALQEQAQLMLTEHVQLVHPRQAVRVGRLLLLPAKLQAIPSGIVERTFFRGLVGAASIPKLIANILHSDIV
ncbi:hypothetical protein C0Q70_11230 [Pomacea canaliculata]|uniref:NR LBD domain-containing protein n=1 Tax=Pomacea canaliculata TaxID=400727 RepID=A0A2T7P5F3_POMCA|nr:hypothetical protein C0Q70_11230 [Pomacea canaliculata]